MTAHKDTAAGAADTGGGGVDQQSPYSTNPFAIVADSRRKIKLHYPINTAEHMAALQEQFSGRENLIEFCRDYLIPAMNDAYQDGKAGVSGYMQDPVAEITIFEKATGPLTDRGKRHIAAFIRCLNTAYAQGQQDAGRVTA